MHMTHTCKNCGNIFEGNYCNNCGQPAETHKIDTKFLAHDLQHGLFHLDGGIFYSAREMFRRPGHAAREYIEGKRVMHYKPLSMTLVLAGIYVLIYHALGINVFSGNGNEDFDYEAIGEWIMHHYAILTLLLIPVYSLVSYIVFRRQGYNFSEHLILNSFYSTQKLWVSIIIIPLCVLILGKEAAAAAMDWLLGASALLMIWTYSQFFSELPKVKSFLLSILAYLLSTLCIMIICSIVLLIIIK